MHTKMMKEACENFDLDMAQIKNLYDLILREIAGKSTKKAYNELYNKTYLQEIEDKEKNFEEEVNHMKIQGTVINSNYWRIEGIKNIYEVFQKEVSEKFEKDLSEYKIEEPKEIEEDIDIFGENGDVLDIEDNEGYEEDNSKEDEIEDDEDYIFDEDEDEEIDDELDEYEDDEEFEIDEDENNDDYEEDEDYDESEYDEEYDESYEDDELEDEDYEDDYDDTEETEYYEDEEDDTYDENEYEDEDYEEDEEENYEEDDEEELRTAKITSRSRRGNIDDRLAKYKKKMNEEKQSKGFLGFFKDRKNKQF